MSRAGPVFATKPPFKGVVYSFFLYLRPACFFSTTLFHLFLIIVNVISNYAKKNFITQNSKDTIREGS